jgi:hypothetical protein
MSGPSPPPGTPLPRPPHLPLTRSHVRDSHDGKPVRVATPRTDAERCKLASQFQADYGLEIPVLVDSVNGGALVGLGGSVRGTWADVSRVWQGMSSNRHTLRGRSATTCLSAMPRGLCGWR